MLNIRPARTRVLGLSLLTLALLASLGTGLLGFSLGARRAGPPAAHAEPPAKPADPLETLNDSFRAAYRRGRAETLAHAGPVILAEGDDVVLLSGGQREAVTYMPAAYHELKAVSHVPLALYVQLAPFGDGPLDGDRLDELRRYRAQLTAARDSLVGRGFGAATLERQQKIVAESLAFLDGILDRRRASADEVKAFTRRLGPLLLASAEEAARLQIDALHAQTAKWRRQLGPEAWQRLHVVVVGSAMPRQGNLAVQYYARLLGEPGEGRRLVYAEALWDEAKARDLLGTHLLDTAVGDAFFGDDQRMHRDLLADAAADYLKQLRLEP
jgi:hypothetical protein